MNVYVCSATYKSLIQGCIVQKGETVVSCTESDARYFLSIKHKRIDYNLWEIRKVDQTLPGVVEI